MGNNSIRSNLDKDYIISDLRLSLSDDIYKEKVFVIVEGEDDIKFLKSYLKDDTIILYESFDGKNGVSEIVKHYFPDEERVIGIRDKDYLNYEESPKLFFYDNCCLEMMLVESNDAFDSIYSEFYKGEMQSTDLKNKILKELKIISIIRMYNEKFQWAINLKVLSINNVFIQDIYGIDNEKVVQELNSANNDIIDYAKIQMINEYGNKVQAVRELLVITQGHDFSSLFAAICNSHSKKHFNCKTIEMALRCSYTKKDFKVTRLHDSLKRYQENIGIMFLTT